MRARRVHPVYEAEGNMTTTTFEIHGALNRKTQMPL
jgi:hypothetical protein